MSRKSRFVFFLTIVSPFLLTVWAAGAQAQGRVRGGGHEGGNAARSGAVVRGGDRDGDRDGRSGVVVRGGFRGGIYDPFYDDPFWNPYPWGPYGYVSYSDNAEVRVLSTPKDAEVYVDGYYAGIVDNFNGIFQRLNVRPGGHEFVLYRAGFHAVHQTVYLQPGSSLKLQYPMVPLAPGQTMEPRPVPADESAGPPIELRSGAPRRAD